MPAIRASSTTGVMQLDELCVEHNNLLALPGHAWSLQALIDLLPTEWDELLLPAVDAATFAPLAASADYQVLIDRSVASPYVELARVRAAGDYVKLLGGNTRSQIRRARRGVGALTVEPARTTAEAFAIYDQLIALHQASWRERGQPGLYCLARDARRLSAAPRDGRGQMDSDWQSRAVRHDRDMRVSRAWLCNTAGPVGG